MQVRRDLTLATRMLDNWARLVLRQIKKGEDYRQHRPVISLWILSHDLWSDEGWLHVFGARETAKVLKELGVDVDVIAKATRLSRAEAEGL